MNLYQSKITLAYKKQYQNKSKSNPSNTIRAILFCFLYLLSLKIKSFSFVILSFFSINTTKMSLDKYLNLFFFKGGILSKNAGGIARFYEK